MEFISALGSETSWASQSLVYQAQLRPDSQTEKRKATLAVMMTHSEHEMHPHRQSYWSTEVI